MRNRINGSADCKDVLLIQIVNADLHVGGDDASLTILDLAELVEITATGVFVSGLLESSSLVIELLITYFSAIRAIRITNQVFSAIGIGVDQWTASRIGVSVPALWIILIYPNIVGIDTYEPALCASVVSCAEVIQPRFIIPFFLR